jgi:hypothetical protein
VDARSVEQGSGCGHGEAVETARLHDGPGAGSVEDEGQLSGEQSGVGCAAAFGLVLEERAQRILLPAGNQTRRVFG